MSKASGARPVDRRTFLRNAAATGGAALAALYSGAPLLAERAPWIRGVHAPLDGIGLQLFTVRDRTAKDYPGTLMDVAKIGYKEVQTTGSYGDFTAQQIKEFLDRAGLRSPATHVSPPNGPDFEKTLEGYRLIGHEYTTVRTGDAPARRPPAAAPGGGGAPAAGAPARRPPAPPRTLDSVKREAEQLNQAGRITQKHGLKVIVHNHTMEFAPLADSPLVPYDVLLSETDPELVALELDIGWARVAGQDPLALFRKSPGRFEVWHVKDMAGLSALEGKSESERMRAAQIVPMGKGEIDYGPIFAQAELAGMKHYFVEQDSAPQDPNGSVAAAAESYRFLTKLLA